jgi:uncharacterized protein (DUF58 family)
LRALRREAQETAAHVRLSLQHRNWQGTVGNWSGAGTGSSIDFQDHRPYLPGDDPRYIDWAAYARSGQTIMKLYREEVSPRVDVIVDLSRSMVAPVDRAERVLGLVFFCLDSAAALGASLRVYTVQGERWQPVDPLALHTARWEAPEAMPAAGAPRIEAMPLAHGSLRLFISDLLYPEPPAGLARSLVAGRGRAVVVMPWRAAEENPDWEGNHEFIDIESGARRRQRVTPELRDRYRAAYRRHVDGWREALRRVDARFARVACDGSLRDSLVGEAMRQGVVEAWT